MLPVQPAGRTCLQAGPQWRKVATAGLGRTIFASLPGVQPFGFARTTLELEEEGVAHLCFARPTRGSEAKGRGSRQSDRTTRDGTGQHVLVLWFARTARGDRTDAGV